MSWSTNVHEGCLGDVVAALVDGELDDAGRERAHRHLAHCAGCRAEVDAQRRLKVRLSGVGQPEASDALTARLLRLPAVEREQSAVRSPSRPAAVHAVPTRPAGSSPRAVRPATARRRALRRRATTGSAFAVLGVAAALALGAPQPRPATPSADPVSGVLVGQLVGTPAGSSTAVLPASRTAGLPGFVPLTRTTLTPSAVTRSALLSTGAATAR